MNRKEDRQKAFKGGLDKDGARQKRGEQTNRLRRSSREEDVQRRRTMTVEEEASSSESPELTGQALVVYQSIVKFRQLLSQPDHEQHAAAAQKVIEAGLVPQFIAFLQCVTYPQVQLEAAWCLTNVASESLTHAQVIVESGGVPVLLQRLQSQDPQVCEQCAWALGNIAASSCYLRDFVLKSNGVAPLVDQIQKSLPSMRADAQPSPSLLRRATWAMANLCHAEPGKPFPDTQQLSQAIPVLSHLLFVADSGVVAEAVRALSYIPSGNDQPVALVGPGSRPEQLVILMGHGQIMVQMQAVIAVGNLLAGDADQTQAILDAGCLPPLHMLLRSPNVKVRTEAARALSNVAAGTGTQIAALIQSGALASIITAMGADDFEVKRECAWVVCNIAEEGNDAYTKHLVDQGALPPMAQLLPVQDPDLVFMLLGGLRGILQVGKAVEEDIGYNPYAVMLEEVGGLDGIEALQEHDNLNIYQAAVDILEEFFGDDEDEDMAIAPGKTADDSQFSFGFKSDAVAGQPLFHFLPPEGGGSMDST